MTGNRKRNLVILTVLILIAESSGSRLERQSSFEKIKRLRRDVEKEDETVNLGRSNNVRPELIENGIEINYADREEENLEQDGQSSNSTRFSFEHHHQSGHEVYAGRSLMSVEGIVRNVLPDEDRAESSIFEDDSSIKARSRERQDTSDPLKTSDYAEKEWQLMFRNIDLTSDNIQSSILQQIGKQTNLFEEIFSRLKPECKRDIYHIGESAKKHKLWALRMLDSNGKLPSGVTYGKFSSPGDYEECLSVRVDEHIYKPDSSGSISNQPEHHKFRGKYCLIDFRLPLPERPRNKLLSIHDPVVDLSDTELGKQFPILKNYSGYASVFYDVGYMHAFCIPSTCDIFDITKSVGKSLEGLYIIVNNTVDCEVLPDEGSPAKLRTSQVVSAILVGLVLMNAALASAIHYLKSERPGRVSPDKLRTEKNKRSSKPMNDESNYKDNHNSHQVPALARESSLKSWICAKIEQYPFYTECFSVQTNFARLTKPDPRGLTFVHYTRIVAMGLTVITHTAGMGTLQAVTKPADASNSEQIFRDFIPQMLANAFTSIQIFFFMAGFMLVISTYPSISREKGHLSFMEYAIKRAIRLMPGLAATICLNFLWPLFVDGPMLTYFIRVIVEPCETSWWRTMAFLSNFDNAEKMCIRHSYFSASDYQLHLMAFPLLPLLYKQPAVALFIAGLLTVTGFVAQVIMILTKTVLPFMMVDYIDKEAFLNVVHYIHHPVWNHMSAFFYGFIIGYLVVKQIHINISDKTIKRIWMITLPAGVISIFAPYFWNHYKRPIHKWQMVLYVLLDRFTLLTTCAWLSYASMALSRRKKKNTKKQTDSNLPITVSLKTEEKSEQSRETVGVNTDRHAGNLPSVEVTHELRQTDPEDPGQQHYTGGTTPISLRRQRSSPNFSLPGEAKGVEESRHQLRPALSSQNLGTSLTTSESQEPKQMLPIKYDDIPKAVVETKKRRVQVSNVNTLCLILSRLTFQLYLFNMVVLWIDVNHSKYYWYFSYYFIITKSLAVYICSSILAMIFFVALESPSLTLYILWVKSRAKARADRKSANQSKQEVVKTDGEAIADDKRKTSTSTLNDGLQMKTGLGNPTISFVNLTVTPQSPESRDETFTRLTKM